MAASGKDRLTAAEWLSSFEATNGVVDLLSNEVNEAGNRPGGATARDKRNASKKLQTARDDLDRLERTLGQMETAPATFKIGEGEVVRRRGLLSQLKSSLLSLEDATQGKTKRDLLSGGKVGRGGRVKVAEETDETREQSSKQLFQAQQQAVDVQQEEKLDVVLAGVGRLKDMSKEMNNELNLHQRLLGELGDAVDATDERIRVNTKRVEIVEKEEGGCAALLCMILLFIIIIFLAATNYACHIFASDKC
jgi:syntaxin 8